MRIERDADGRWQASTEATLSEEKLHQLAHNWQHLPANRVQRIDSGALVGDPVQALFADGQQVDFLVISIQPEIIIANPGLGLQYHFRAAQSEQLIVLPGVE